MLSAPSFHSDSLARPGGRFAAGLQLAYVGQQAHLVGFSFGGRLAGEAAALKPERVATLTLVAPGGVGIEDAPRPEMAKLRPKMAPAEFAAVERKIP